MNTGANKQVGLLVDIIMSLLSKIFKEGKVLQGKATKDRTYESAQTFSDRNTARSEFERSKIKLFDVNGWSEMPGITSTFELFDSQGQRIKDRSVKTNDFIRIELPGPVPENWVVVTVVNDGEDTAEFTVSPSKNPRETGQEIKHFFIKEATSTFKIEIKNNTIYSYEIGKNEGINNEGVEAGDRELINTLLAEGGWAAFQKIQWKKLTDYLVHIKEAKQ